MFDRILLPLNGTEVGEAALEPARLLAERLDGELVVLRVVEPHPATVYGSGEAPPPPTRGLAEAERAALAEAEAYVRDVADRLSGYVRVRAAVRHGEPLRQILRAARDFGCGVVALATHGHGPLRRMVGGSLTEQVLRHGGLPVLLVRAQVRRVGAHRAVAADRAEPGEGD